MSVNNGEGQGSPSANPAKARSASPLVAGAAVVGVLLACGGGAFLLKSLAERQESQCAAALATGRATPTLSLLESARALCKSAQPEGVAALEQQVAEAEQLAKDRAGRAALVASGLKPEQLERATMEAVCRQRGSLAVVRVAAQLPGPPRFWECDESLVYLGAPATPALCEAKGYEYATLTAIDGSATGACKRKAKEVPVGLMRVKTAGAYVGAVVKAKLDRAVELSASGDRAAFDRYIKSEPGVFIVTPGLEVVLVETAGLLASEVKVRKPGDTAEFWVLREAIESP